MKKETIIPFSGFYNTIWDYDYDDDEVEFDWEKINWKETYTNIAREYVEGVNKEFELNLEFKLLDSPREYNFTTDRIFAEISKEDYDKVFAKVDKEKLQKRFIQEFTSRDGFISHYSPDIEEYELENFDSETVDHNIIEIILSVYFEQEEKDWEMSIYYDIDFRACLEYRVGELPHHLER